MKRIIIEVVGGCVQAAYGDGIEYLVLDFDNIAASGSPPDPHDPRAWEPASPFDNGAAACADARAASLTATLESEPARFVASPTLALRVALTGASWRSLRVAPVEQTDESCRELGPDELHLADFWTVYATDDTGRSQALADFTTRRLAQSALDAICTELASGGPRLPDPFGARGASSR